MIQAPNHQSREALREHLDMLRDVNDAIENLTQRIDDEAAVDEVLTLVAERRQLRDRQEALQARDAKVKAAAESERVREVRAAMDQAWAPVAERKVEQIKELERQVEAMAALLAEIEATTAEQMHVVDMAGSIDRQQAGHWQVQLNSQKGYRLAWLCRALGVAQQFPSITSAIPASDDAWGNESLSLQGRLW